MIPVRIAGALAALALAAVACGDARAPATAPTFQPPAIPASGPITIALTGDTSFASDASDADLRVRATFDLVRSATLGFTNLETPLLDDELALRPATARRPVGRTGHAAMFRGWGFDLVSLANNHAMDRARDGLRSTIAALDGVYLGHAGAGENLETARAPSIVGASPRRVALIAVTASSAPETRASASQPDIAGRPGVHALEYTASITVDPATYATLKQSVRDLQAGPPPGERELTFFGTRIVRGDQIRVDIVLNTSSTEPILETIRAARASAEIVMVSVHAHEPSNLSDEPATFVREFAHAAVDAGAQIVVGHGPHRLRGAEIYRGAVVLYSLGNFIFATGGLGVGEADPFDAGLDLQRMALGALDAARPQLPDQLAEEWWWQGLLALVTVDGGRPVQLRVYPLDLVRPGGGEAGSAGLPRLAQGPMARAVLGRFVRLSGTDGAAFTPMDDGTVLERPIPQFR